MVNDDVTPREALRARCEAIWKVWKVRTHHRHNGPEYVEFMKFIIDALAAERAAEAVEIARHIDEGEILLEPDELDARCKCQCFGVLGRLSTWCEARTAAWREKGVL